MSTCEWNPTANRPSFDTDTPHGDATQAVGIDGKWLLCDACAASATFKRYRNRRQLYRKGRTRVVRRAHRQAAYGGVK